MRVIDALNYITVYRPITIFEKVKLNNIAYEILLCGFWVDCHVPKTALKIPGGRSALPKFFQGLLQPPSVQEVGAYVHIGQQTNILLAQGNLSFYDDMYPTVRVLIWLLFRILFKTY